MPTQIDQLSIEITSTARSASESLRELSANLRKLGNASTANGIGHAITNLRALNRAASEMRSVGSFGAMIREFSRGLESLKSVGSFNGVASSVQALRTALTGFPMVDSRLGEAMYHLGNGMAAFSQVSPQRVQNTAESMRIMANSIRFLNGLGDTSGTGTALQSIATALGPLSNLNLNSFTRAMTQLQNLDRVTASLSPERVDAFGRAVQRLADRMAPLAQRAEQCTEMLREFNRAAANRNFTNATNGAQNLGRGLNVASINSFALLGNMRHIEMIGRRIVNMVAPFIDEAANFEGIGERFMRGYQEYAEETYGWFQRLNTEMGLNVQRMMQYSSIYAQMLQGMGVSNQKDIASISTGLTELGYDIWAAYNDVYGSYEDVAAALKSGLAGQVRPLRSAGFDITNAALERTAALHGLEVKMSDLTQAEKTYLRYQTLVDQAMQQGIVGTYAHEMETAEGVMRTLAQEVKTLGQAFGSLFLPLLTKAIPIVTGFVEFLTDAVRYIAGLFGIQLQVIDFSSQAFGAVTGFGDEMTESLEEAGGAAKELQKSILGFDELNVLSASSSSSGGGGGGGGGGSLLNPDGGLGSLDVSSLWTDAIFANVSKKAHEVRDAIAEWVTNLTLADAIINGGPAAAGIGLVAAIAAMGVSAIGVKNALLSIATMSVVAVVSWKLGNEFGKSGDESNLVAGLITDLFGGVAGEILMGPAGVTVAMAISATLGTIGFTDAIRGGAEPGFKEKLEMGIKTALEGAIGGGFGAVALGAIEGGSAGAGAGPLGIIIGATIGLAVSGFAFWWEVEDAELDVEAKKFLSDHFDGWIDYAETLRLSISNLEVEYKTGVAPEIILDAMNFRLSEIAFEFTDGIDSATQEIKDELEISLNELFRDAPLGVTAGTTTFSTLFDSISTQLNKVPESTKRAARTVWDQYVRPSKELLDDIAADYRKGGITCTDELREGLTYANQTGALAGDVDSIAWIVGQQMANGSEFLNMLATAEGVGAKIPSNVATGVLDNLNYITDENGAIVGLRDAVTGEIIKMTPILEQNMADLGVDMVGKLADPSVIFKAKESTEKLMSSVTSAMTLSNGNKVVIKNTGEMIMTHFYDAMDIKMRKTNWRFLIDNGIMPILFPASNPDSVKKAVTENGTTIVGGLYESMSAEIESQNWSLLGAKLSDKIASGMYTPTLTVNAKLKFSEAGLSMREDPMHRNTYYVSQMWATGGFPTSGEIFMARENGMPEYVGSMGNRTAVANNDQIVEGIAQGVSDANEAQNALLREQNRLLAEILNQGATSGGGGTSSQDVVAALTRANQRAGRTIVNVGV